MNFRKASIFQRDTEKPEEQNDSCLLYTSDAADDSVLV